MTMQVQAPSIGYGVKVCPGCVQKGCVPPDIAEELQAGGFRKPVVSLMDPRLSYPEMFLQGGWKRESIAEGSKYSRQVGEASQQVEFGQGVWRRVTTRVGERTHVVEMSPDGRVRQWLQSPALPRLDDQLELGRPLMDAFEESGRLGQASSQPLSAQEAIEIAGDLRGRLDEIRADDESTLDQASGKPGEVSLQDGYQARFYETPCGWEFSSHDPGLGLQTAFTGGGELWSYSATPDGNATALFIDLEDPSKSYRATLTSA